ncbi:MAG: uracil-DNA glycosylase [Pikeienuella sp.]
MTSVIPAEAPRDCRLCPRLAAYRDEVQAKNPDWYNGAVVSFGDPEASLLVVGLAPGVTGAHRTGRPFTGDYAGSLLYETLTKFGWANGKFDARPDDGLALNDCMVTNAVRCVPPQNKPVGAEVNQCRDFLKARIAALPRLRAIICLGGISHASTIRALGARVATHKFGHGSRHEVGRLTVWGSYHCSRYNTNTGVLTTEMFEDVFGAVRRDLTAH